jgi:hypothetical protein
MASKYSSEQKIKRALSALDSAVQEWYAEHNPENKEHYADASFMLNDGYCVCRITLNSDPAGKVFLEIKGGRHGYGKGGHQNEAVYS